MRRFMQIATGDIIEIKNNSYRWAVINGLRITKRIWHKDVDVKWDVKWFERERSFIELSIKHYYGRIQKI